jgi:hypothetical protein
MCIQWSIMSLDMFGQHGGVLLSVLWPCVASNSRIDTPLVVPPHWNVIFRLKSGRNHGKKEVDRKIIKKKHAGLAWSYMCMYVYM